jgi:hypothetical protein
MRVHLKKMEAPGSRLQAPGRRRSQSLVLTAALAFGVLGCEDIRRFEGVWVGSVSADPAHQMGFASESFLRANIGSVTRSSVDMQIDLPQHPVPLAFEPIRGASADVLGDMKLEGEPLRTFIGYLRPPGTEPFLAVVSLFAADRIDVRIIRGPAETYGVFSLRRARSVMRD